MKDLLISCFIWSFILSSCVYFKTKNDDKKFNCELYLRQAIAWLPYDETMSFKLEDKFNKECK